MWRLLCVAPVVAVCSVGQPLGLRRALSPPRCGTARRPERPPQAESLPHAARRQALRKNLGDTVLVLFGNTERDVDTLRFGFYQEPNFYYLTGWTEPRAILLLAADREILFVPKRSEAVERYTGRKAAADEVKGFEKVLPIADFERELAAALQSHESLGTLKSRLKNVQRLEQLAPMRAIAEMARPIALLRAKKSAGEIARIEKATAVTVEAHRSAWRRIQPGLYEYQVAATMEFQMHDRGCRPGYTSIVASGENGTVLHYSENTRRMNAGELVLMDVAAACDEYTSDVTRTVPVSGKFTPRQRELYDIVLGAQQATIDAIKPGATMKSINQVCRDYLEAHGKLAKYLTHQISHGVGLEAHDAPSHLSPDPLEAGMVITVEPGLYVPEEKIGIRIEDVVLVTESGARVLSAALPKTADAIEKALSAR